MGGEAARVNLVPDQPPMATPAIAWANALVHKGRYSTGGGAQANEHRFQAKVLIAGCYTEVEQPARPGTSSRRRGWKVGDGWVAGASRQKKERRASQPADNPVLR